MPNATLPYTGQQLPGFLAGTAAGLCISVDTCGRQDALSGAVVVIGGSYAASGDLRTTPLNSDVPGAVVHINAIRAFAQALAVN